MLPRGVAYTKVILFPLISYILIADAFSRMIQSKVQEQAIHGARTSRNGPEISHLLFADDSLFSLELADRNAM